MKEEKTLELALEELEKLDKGLENLDGYVNEVDQRLKTLENEIDRLFEVETLLKAIRREFGIGLENVKNLPDEPVRSAVRKGDTDLDEGEN